MKKTLLTIITIAFSILINAETFTVASLNVDGLPKSIAVKVMGITVTTVNLNPDAKEGPGAQAIGQKLKAKGWDILAVSEDFNFHSNIWNEAWNNGVEEEGVYSYNATTHRGKVEATSSAISKIMSQSSPVFDTDGLCLFYRHTRVTPSQENWTHWNEHYGYTEDGADGLIDKGYRYYCCTLKTGEEIDVYILHMDAETSEQDNAARDSQIRQLAAAIIASNNGRPIIVMGDTNCRYTRDRLKAHFIDVLNADPRFTVKDPFIEHTFAGKYPAVGDGAIMDQGSVQANRASHGHDYGEIVDKIFYINNNTSSKRITAKNYKMDYGFINEQGEPLADHWPIVVDFDIHDYDPEKDGVEETVFFRNQETGKYLKAGGRNGLQLVQGDYPMPMRLRVTKSSAYSGKECTINTLMGQLTVDGKLPMVAGNTDLEWIVAPKSRTDNSKHCIYYKSGTSKMALSAVSTQEYPSSPNVSDISVSVYNTYDHQLWDVLTGDDLRQEMLLATEENPVNVTYLLGAANFDNLDVLNGRAWNGWPTTATKMTYTISGGLPDNPCSEVYCQSYTGTGDYSTEWEVSQSVTDIPNGIYKVTMQGFYRDGDMNQNDPGTVHAYLSARSGGEEERVPLLSMYSAECDDAELASKVTERDNAGNVIPNSMTDASWFFYYGYYQNDLTVKVTDGTLTIAVGKDVRTKSTSGWTCFDNFQLYYLGDPESGVDEIYAPSFPISRPASITDLSGRTLNGVPQKGVYILGGKKYVK